MTPCERLGFKEGDTFSYQGPLRKLLGKEFTLFVDDGTKDPWFRHVDNNGIVNLFILELSEVVPVNFVQENE